MNEPNPDETADHDLSAIDQTVDSAASPLADVSPVTTVAQSHEAAKQSAEQSYIASIQSGEPERLGRYTVLRKLGSGGYGVVYLALDETLERVVAVKVPRGERVKPEQIEEYIREAKLVANLEHPAIVRVYDCGTTDDGRCYVVSQYVDGGDLADWLKSHKAEAAWAVELIIRISEALHHAHKNRIVHRDVKPSNILLDGNGAAYLADFGLALREEDFGRGSNYAGTPRYMSPEQARGEGHRVDGRSDLYSIGVVLYEMLSGRVPFIAESITGLLDQIQVREPPPLRLHAETVPLELERIVAKVLSKRAADRYPTALDFVDDLKTWLDTERRKPASTTSPVASGSASASAETPGSTVPDRAETRPPRVVPKGLRAFDANDADFFLRLLPGPRDRDGLPDSLRFWKQKLEAPGGLAVGLMYGPSGCGKSSFVKAGLLPRLAMGIDTIALDATPRSTEDRLLQLLVAKGAVKAPSLSETLLRMRKHAARRTVIVIDQFEQWLAAHPNPDDHELTNALRQCDGGAVKVLLLIRDDFWMAATRLFRALEIPLQEGENSAAVDLFDKDHARKVLAGFGRAYGRLPAKRTEYTPAQVAFLDRAVDELADSAERIVCVRLALFAEMVKGRAWEAPTLDAIGGLAGVGTAFLEETFGTSAPPVHRYHAAAARAVLEALLPPPGAVIKSSPAAATALAEVAGYKDRPKDFDELLKLLDGELRLITPVEADNTAPEVTRYQLTHDYLVPSLRDWLTRKRRETPRGRAELLLEERAALWQARPLRRHEPNPLEWLQIRARTLKRTWTEPQNRMMARAGRRLGLQVFAMAVLLIGTGFAKRSFDRAQAEKAWAIKSDSLLKQLETAESMKVPGLIAEIQSLQPSMMDKAAVAYQAEPSSTPMKLRLELLQANGDVERLIALHDQQDGDAGFRHAALNLIMNAEGLTAAKLIPLLPRLPEAHFSDAIGKLRQLPDANAQLGIVVKSILDADGIAIPIVTGKDQEQLRSAYQQASDKAERHRQHAVPVLRAAFFIGNTEAIITWLASAPSTDLKAAFIADVAHSNADPAPLAASAMNRKWTPPMMNLLLAIGSFNPQRIPIDTRGQLTQRLLKEFQTNPDAGIHSACDWILRRWNEGTAIAAIEKPLQGIADARRRWFINGQGQSFALFRETSHTFMMGAQPGESDRLDDRDRHERTIPRAFAIGLKEVTVADMQKWLPDYNKLDKRYSPDDKCPATSMPWKLAAVYCNRLSEVEGLKESDYCYISADDGTPQLAPNYLNRRGYRMPTEAEWEFAARAGSDTARHYGNADELLPAYAFFQKNAGDHLNAVGSLKPNRFGLFDILGNASEWCINDYASVKAYPMQRGLDLPNASQNLKEEEPRVVRGGSFLQAAIDIRSARRFASQGNLSSPTLGLRLARTLVDEQ